MKSIIQITKVDSLNETTKFVAAINPKGIVDAITEKSITPAEIRTLIVIASFFDAETGQCYPSLTTIGKILGVDKAAISRQIRSLSNKGFLKVETVEREGDWSYNTYVFNDNLVAYEDTLTDEEYVSQEYISVEDKWNEREITNSKDFIEYFIDKYRETYDEEYIADFKKDGSFVKRKLIGTVSSDELKGMIDVCFRDYPSKWSSREYPRPCIYPMTDWLGRKCWAIYTREKKEADRIARLQTEAEDNSDKFLNM